MSLLASLMQAWDVASKSQRALAAARAVLAAGGSPLAAFDAFAADTGTALDDVVAAELRDGIVRVIGGLEVLVSGAVTLSEALADPRVKTALDQAVAVLVENGYWASMLRARLRGWLKRSAPRSEHDPVPRPIPAGE